MKAGFKPLISGIVLFVLGLVVVLMALVLHFLWGDSEDPRFRVPGTFDFEATEAGRFYLWNVHEAFFEGTTYHRSESLPDGMEISVADTVGQELDLVSDRSLSFSDTDSAKQSIGYLELSGPTTLSIQVSGDFAPRVFSISRPEVLKVILKIVAGVVATLLLAAGGIGLIVWGIVRLAKR